jgi:arylsulfatase
MTTASGIGSHNILFIFSDQEHYFPQWPSDLSLPGHERLQRDGITFHNHYCPAVMCTSSRSVLMTGLQTAANGMFDNTNAPYQPNMSTEIPTFGRILQNGGYHAAYKGKWHLSKDFDIEEPGRLLVDEMAKYGFADYHSIGDVIGHMLGGYENDHMVTGNAIRWMRHQGQELNEAGKPWALTVSLVNPHDVMFFNTDLPGDSVQDTGNLVFKTARAPNHEIYKENWDIRLPESLRQDFNEPGRPRAHGEYQNMWSYMLGAIPYEDERWLRLNNYYINCIRHVDLQISRILAELDALGLTENTIVVYTSDHGEMAGAHGLHGKGPFAYEECIHLPFYVVHPDVNGGQDCRALSGHIDVTPTLLSMAGLDATRRSELAGRDLPGNDLTSLLDDPGNAAVTELREGVLFTYSALMTNDAEPFRRIAEARAAGKDAKSVLADGYRPDFAKRGNVRTVFDGKYKFSRYFGPVERNRPTNLDELYANNEVELFNLESDPQENINLGPNKGDEDKLVLAMNAKLNTLMDNEYGPDDGREMPDFDGIDWSIERPDL